MLLRNDLITPLPLSDIYRTQLHGILMVASGGVFLSFSTRVQLVSTVPCYRE